MKSFTFLFLACSAGLGAAAAQVSRPLVTQRIDEAQTVTLAGNIHPLARPQNDLGAAPDTHRLSHMRLLLRRAPGQESAATLLIRQLHDPASTSFHRWLTPEQVGGQFGADPRDIETAGAWLGSHGLQIDRVSPNRLAIEFSGTAAQVRDAFGAGIHRYVIHGREHWANASDPRVPSALAPLVAGIAGLNDFGAHASARAGGRARRSEGRWTISPTPDTNLSFNGNQYYLVGPSDFATIYNLSPLWSSGITGQGQTIALVEDSAVNPADIDAFRAGLGLPALQPGQLQIVCVPQAGCATTPDEVEGAIDAEWAGAVAPAANILYVVADTLEDSAAYIVNNNLAPVVSIGFSQCESDLGSSGNAFWGSLWQTAVLQGITVVAAAGDHGGAACDTEQLSAPTAAAGGLAVNGIASTPNNVAVGGTDFSDTFAGTNSTYWSASNSPTTLQSALSYVPEMTWNNSCASNVLTGFVGFPRGEALCEVLPVFIGTNPLYPLNIVAGPGGPSTCAVTGGPGCQGYVKPDWQANVAGLVNDGVRDLPDVSLFASNNAWSHAYLFCMSDVAQNGSPCDYNNAGDTVFNSGGGTSFAAAAFAGVVALIGQQTGSPQGNVNYNLYSLAAAEYANPQALSACGAGQGNQVSSTCIFYDVTLGDTTVPCQTGSPDCFTATAGDPQGVLSTSTASLASAYDARPGWDFATGLGSVNIFNLVTGWGTSAAEFVISGQVAQSGGPLAGVKVTLTGARTGTAKTNSSGKFSFVVPGGRSYTVTPSLNGYSFTPSNRVFKMLSRNQAVNFSGTGSLPEASLSTGLLEFGSLNAGVPGGAQSVVLSNIGNGPLTLSSISTTGASAADFSQTNTCGTLPAQIAAGAGCTVRVVFTPSVAGPETAALTFTDNSGGAAGSTQVVSLTGTGIVTVTVSPVSLNFGYSGIHVAALPRTVTITNASAIPVAVSKFMVTGTNGGDFQVSGKCPVSLAAGAKCSVRVGFTPSAAGTRSATLSIADSATGSPQTVALSGTGTDLPVIGISRSSLTFPATSVGSSSAPQTVAVTNGGLGELSIIGVSASNNFDQTNNCTTSLASGASCTITVTFTPAQTGAISGTLKITGNGIVNSVQVRLSGTGM